MAIKSIVSRRLVKDHMYANDLQPHTIDISNALKLSVKSARQKYQIILEEEKAAKKKDANDNQKQIIVSEIKDKVEKRTTFENL